MKEYNARLEVRKNGDGYETKHTGSVPAFASIELSRLEGELLESSIKAEQEMILDIKVRLPNTD